MNGPSPSPAVSLSVDVACAPLDTLPAQSQHTFPLDATKPHLIALQEAVEATRQRSNAILTAWKNEIGDREKGREKQAQIDHEAAKRAQGQEEGDSEEEVAG